MIQEDIWQLTNDIPFFIKTWGVGATVMKGAEARSAVNTLQCTE